MKRKLFIGLLSAYAMVTFSAASSAQGLSEAIRLHSAFNGGEFATASPSVASMIRYGDCQLDLFHGRMGLQVPLYEYTDRDFNIPIILGYSTQGYQPGLDAGVCGLGWNLSCGGCITREVRGIPDDSIAQERIWKWAGDRSRENSQISESFWVYNLSNELRSQSSVNIDGYYALWSMDEDDYASVSSALDCYYEGALNHDYEYYYRKPDSGLSPLQGYETQSDIYHFSFLGINGDFVLQPCGRILVYNCNVPSGCVNVEWSWRAGEVHSHSVFTIRTGDGMSYEFGQMEDSYCYDNVNGSMSDECTNTSWLLTRITAPNGRYAAFHYSQSSSTSYSPSICVDYLRVKGTDGTWRETWRNSDDDGENVAYVDSHTHVTVNVSECYRLDSVEIPSMMRVEFGYEGGSLVSMSVYNSEGRCVRSVGMTYSASQDTPSFLKSVSVSGQGTWTFGYYSEDLSFPAPATYATDNFGFYNGCSSYKDYQVPQYRYGIDLDSYAEGILTLRSPSLQHASMGALKRIGWPSGGYSTVSYGLNRAMENGSEDNSYGIRPESIWTHDKDGNLLQKRSFIYTDESGDCSGKLLMKPQIYYRYTISTTSMDSERESVSTLSSVGLGPKAFQEYHTVIERISGSDPYSSVAETVHRYDCSSFASLTDFTEYFTSSSTSSAIGDGSWTYSYSNGWVPDDRQMMGESYFSGHEVNRRDKDGIADCMVSSTGSVFHSQSVTSDDIRFPAMLCNRRSELVINPRHMYCSSQADSSWCTSGTMTTIRGYSLDSSCRPSVQTVIAGGEELHRIHINYLNDMSLLPAEIEERTFGTLSRKEKVDYVDYGNSSSPWYLPVGYSRYDLDNGIWQAVSTVLSFDASGNPTSIADALGNVQDLVWTPDGLHLCRRTLHPSAGQSLETSWDWIPMVGMSRCTEPTGKVTEWRYDRNGRLVQKKVCGDIVGEAAYNIVTE